MGFGASRQIVFGHRAGGRINPAQNVRPLAGPPDRTIGSLDRIPRPLAQCRHQPFLEGQREIAGDWRRPSVVAGWIGGSEIIEDSRMRLRISREIYHRRGKEVPVRPCIATAALDFPHIVASRTNRLDQIAAISFREGLGSGPALQPEQGNNTANKSKHEPAHQNTPTVIAGLAGNSTIGRRAQQSAVDSPRCTIACAGSGRVQTLSRRVSRPTEPSAWSRPCGAVSWCRRWPWIYRVWQVCQACRRPFWVCRACCPRMRISAYRIWVCRLWAC